MGYLQGQVKRTVEGFNINNENYQKALDLLCERFGDTEVIITIHMNVFLKIKYLKSDKDVAGLQQLYETLEVHVRSLLFLNIDSECNWIIGSSVNVLTDLIIFRHQTAIKYTTNF